jgi:hypothetical protein
MSIKCVVTNSLAKETETAAREVCAKIKNGLGGNRADLLLCFSSVVHDQAKLLGIITADLGGPPLLGCSDAGEITTAGPSKQGVSLMAISAPKIKFSVGAGPDIDKDARQAGVALARSLKQKDPSIALLIMMADGLAGNGADIVRGVLDVMGEKFPVVGGSAGDDFLFKKTYEYLNGKIGRASCRERV